MKTAYSYARCSTTKQADEGDSIRRQTEEWPRQYAQENTLHLVPLAPDRGVSGFKGRNVKTGQLAAFLKEIEAGLIKPGSFFLVENLDRISRQEIDPATEIVKKILRAGITIVTRTPFEIYRPEILNDLGKMIMLPVIMFRANEESTTKGKRVAATKRQIRETGFTKHGKRIKKCPAWLRLSEDGKKYVAVPENAAIVKKVFRLAAEGMSQHQLLDKLNTEKVPYLGRKTVWNRSGLRFLLTSRTVLGEFQACEGYGSKSDRKPVGDPIQGYYPQVVSNAEFYAVQASMKKREKTRGPIGEEVANLFAGRQRNRQLVSTSQRDLWLLRPIGRDGASRVALVALGVWLLDGDPSPQTALPRSVVEATQDRDVRAVLGVQSVRQCGSCGRGRRGSCLRSVRKSKLARPGLFSEELTLGSHSSFHQMRRIAVNTSKTTIASITRYLEDLESNLRLRSCLGLLLPLRRDADLPGSLGLLDLDDHAPLDEPSD